MIIKVFLLVGFILAAIMFLVIISSAKASRFIVKGPTRAIYHYNSPQYEIKYSKRNDGTHILDFYISARNEDFNIVEQDWGNCEIWLDDDEVVYWEVCE